MKEIFNYALENIMLIDDNSIDLYITSQTIKRNYIGKNVLQYSNAEEALKFLLEHWNHSSLLPRIILVDIYMPGMSGFEFMSAYDQLPSVLKSFCKVFIVSSSIDSDDLDKANKDKNVTAFREKPVSKEFLFAVSKSYALPG